MTALLLSWSTLASAAVLTVDPSSSTDHPTIASAIEAAESGDTVALVGGTYAECVNTLGKDLTFTGPSTGPAAVIDGTGLCWSTVVAEAEETLSFSDLTIANTGGRGLYFWGGTVGLESVVFEALGASDVSGSAIWGAYGSLDTSSCRFDDNTSDEGGAIYLYEGVAWTDTASTFSRNTSARSGGAVFAYANHAIDLTGTAFTDNESNGNGGALYASWYSAINATSTSFTGNTAAYSGGAVHTYVVTGDLVFDDSDFTGNQALDGWGGAIEVEWYSLLQVLGSRFERNTASAAGGAISQWYETSGLSVGSVFSGNLAAASGGAWYWNPYQGRAHDLAVEGSVFTDNTAGSWGGAIYGSWARDIGISESVFRRNTAAGNGGGLAIYVATDVAVHRTEFCRNQAYLGGGAQVEWADADLVSNTRFVDNQAVRGGGLFRYSSGNGASEYNTFVGNTADTWGGAYVDEWGVSTLQNSAFFHNVGGAIFTEFASTATGTLVEFDAWADNTPIDGAGYFQVQHGTDGHVSGDARFVEYTPDGPCSDQDLHPMAGSVLVDAADPRDTDTDGSRADIGAYGGPSATIEDADGDGFTSDVDCIDGDPTVHPGAEELCDGVDNDCNGTVDGSDAIDAAAWFDDADGDGYGDPSTETQGCGASGMVSAGGDCDDEDAEIHPAATERWYDGVDADCAGDSDHDADGDGWDKPVGDNGGRDCNDADPNTYPAAEDPPGDGIDQDCDGADDAASDPDDTTELPASGASGDEKVSGCTTVGGRSGVPVGVGVLLFALFGRRRRPDQSA